MSGYTSATWQPIHDQCGYSSRRAICRKDFPVLGKCGRPYDISTRARPGTALIKSEVSAPQSQSVQRVSVHCKRRGIHAAPAKPSYGRQNATMMTRHPGRDVRPGTRSTIHSPYTHPEEMGPGTAFPLVDFNAPSHVARAARAKSIRCAVIQFSLRSC